MPTLEEMGRQITLPTDTQLQAPSGTPLDAIAGFLRDVVQGGRNTAQGMSRIGQTLTESVPPSISNDISRFMNYQIPMPGAMEDILRDPTGLPQGGPSSAAPAEQRPTTSVEVGETTKDAPEVGMSLSELMENRDEPRGRIDHRDFSILNYEGMNVVVEDGKVTQVHPFEISGETEPMPGEDGKKGMSPERKMLLTEEILSHQDLTPLGMKMHRGRVARKAIEEGADPELVGAWVGGGFEGIRDYFKERREAQQGQAGDWGEASAVQKSMFNDVLRELRDIDKTKAKTLEEESGENVWKGALWWGKPDRLNALTAVMQRPEYHGLLVNPPRDIIPVIAGSEKLMKIRENIMSMLGQSPAPVSPDEDLRAKEAEIARRKQAGQ